MAYIIYNGLVVVFHSMTYLLLYLLSNFITESQKYFFFNGDTSIVLTICCFIWWFNVYISNHFSNALECLKKSNYMVRTPDYIINKKNKTIVYKSEDEVSYMLDEINYEEQNDCNSLLLRNMFKKRNKIIFLSIVYVIICSIISLTMLCFNYYDYKVTNIDYIVALIIFIVNIFCLIMFIRFLNNLDLTPPEKV